MSVRQSIRRKKTSELEKDRTFQTLFPPQRVGKVRSWVLLLSVRVPKKVPRELRKNIRPKAVITLENNRGLQTVEKNDIQQIKVRKFSILKFIICNCKFSVK